MKKCFGMTRCLLWAKTWLLWATCSPLPSGFLEEFGPNRVIDTPISEEGFVGMAVGAAMRGMRPVVELMYDDFATECADPLFNQAAKIRYMTGGQCSVPMVLRAPMGAGRRNAGQHSQSLENFFCHFPGLKVVAPCSAEDAKGLLKTAIRDEDPVIFLEHKLLYAHKEEIPEGEYTIPLGQAKVKREGKDLTIISWSREVNFALEAAKTLEQEGIDVEVLDLQIPGSPGLGRNQGIRFQDPQRHHRLRRSQARQLRRRALC